MAWTAPGAGPGRWDIRIAPLRVEDEPLGVHLVFEDVTERSVRRSRLDQLDGELTTAYEELQTLNDELRDRTLEVDRVNAFLQGILTGLDVAIVVVNAEYRVLLWNAAAERITGLRSFEVEGVRLLELPLLLPEAAVRAALREAVLHGETPSPVEHEAHDRFGRRQLRRLTVSPLRGSGEVHGAVVTLADVVPAG